MFYGLYLRLRNRAYDRKDNYKASVPTICVGNVTVGGTGKTPMVEYVIRKLFNSDYLPPLNYAVLSRGYKRKLKGFQTVPFDGSAEKFGDEPVQIARKFPGVTVAVDKNRIEGCEKLIESGARAIILDDAFQYRKLSAHMNIVLVDYNRPVYKDRLLPWGRLRDLPSRLSKADAVVVTKCPAEMDAWAKREWRGLLRLGENMPLFFTTIDYDAPQPVFPDDADIRYVYSKRAALVSGIACDEPLRRHISDNYKIIRHFAFGDHHRFSNADMRRLASVVKEQPTSCVFTTEKDAQRIRDVKKVPPEVRQRLFYIPVSARFIFEEDENEFYQLLLVTSTLLPKP